MLSYTALKDPNKRENEDSIIMNHTYILLKENIETYFFKDLRVL